MARPQSPDLRCWDGRSKVAAVWVAGADEHRLYSSDANCCIYLSREDYEQQKPSFKVSLDRLVARQCQPLTSNLTMNKQSFDTSGEPPRLFLPGIDSELPSQTSSCSLLLLPPDSANGDEVRQYNITTRNFFAWVVGAPIVGTDPTYALIALRFRMDEWRNPSCNNIFAVQEYARTQFYTEPTDIQLSKKPSQQSLVNSSIDYSLPSTPVHAKSRLPSIVTAVRFGNSLSRRATAILRRRSTGPDSHERNLVEDVPSQVSSSESDLQPKELAIMSEALSNDSRLEAYTRTSSSLVDIGRLGSAYSIATDVADSRALPSLTTSISSDRSASSFVTTPEGRSDTFEAQVLGQSAWPQGTEKELSHLGDEPIFLSPISTELPAPYSNATARHSSSGDRRQPSNIGTGPPSPILEESTTSAMQDKVQTFDDSSRMSRRYSLPPGADSTAPVSRAANISGPSRTGHRSSQSFDNTQRARFSFESGKTQEISTTCKRCKRPSKPPGLSVHQAVTRSTYPLPEPVISAADAEKTGPARWLSGQTSTDLKHEVNSNGDLSRFPSLNRSKSKVKATEPQKSETLPKRNPSRMSLPRRSQSTPLSRTHESHSTELPSLPASVNHGIEGTPLAEQRHTLSVRSNRSRASYETVRPTPPQHIDLALGQRKDEYTLEHEADTSVLVPAPSATSERRQPQSRPASSRSMVVSRGRRSLDYTMTPESKRFSMRPASSSGVIERERKGMFELTASPEQADFSAVMMKSDGRRQSLALLLSDQSELMAMTRPAPATVETEPTDDLNDDQIILDRLLDGLQLLEAKHEPVVTKRYSRFYGNDVSIVSPTTSSFPGTDRKSTSSADTSNPPPTPRSWTRSFRMRKSRHGTPKEVIESLPPQSMDKSGPLQIRVLTMDSTGKFSTLVIDSPIDNVTMDFQ